MAGKGLKKEVEKKPMRHHPLLVSLLVIILLLGVVAYFVQRDMIIENIAGEAIRQSKLKIATTEISIQKNDQTPTEQVPSGQNYKTTTVVGTCREILYLDRGLTLDFYHQSEFDKHNSILKLIKTECKDVGRTPTDGKWAMGCLYEDVFNPEAEKISSGYPLWGGDPYKTIESCVLKVGEKIQQCECVAKIPTD